MQSRATKKFWKAYARLDSVTKKQAKSGLAPLSPVIFLSTFHFSLFTFHSPPLSPLSFILSPLFSFHSLKSPDGRAWSVLVSIFLVFKDVVKLFKNVLKLSFCNNAKFFAKSASAYGSYLKAYYLRAMPKIILVVGFYYCTGRKILDFAAKWTNNTNWHIFIQGISRNNQNRTPAGLLGAGT